MPKKSSKSEDEYFAREERHRQKKQKIQSEQDRLEERRRLHSMKCPKCGADLEAALFRTIEIERCNECEGCWLDRGELEKLAGEEPRFLQDFFGFFRRP